MKYFYSLANNHSRKIVLPCLIYSDSRFNFREVSIGGDAAINQCLSNLIIRHTEDLFKDVLVMLT
jgi:hypothetical protein